MSAANDYHDPDDMWKCARKACGRETRFADLLVRDGSRCCPAPQCGSEDVFPRDDGGWSSSDEGGGKHKPNYINDYDD